MASSLKQNLVYFLHIALGPSVKLSPEDQDGKIDHHLESSTRMPHLIEFNSGMSSGVVVPLGCEVKTFKPKLVSFCKLRT